MTEQILHINGYSENVELPKNYQKKSIDCPLIFLRYFVDPYHTAAKHQLSQIEQLRRYKDHLAIEAVYFRLVKWASTYNMEYRGFIFDCAYEPGRPADLAGIAISFGISLDLCKQYVSALLDRRLIEWVPPEKVKAMIAETKKSISESAEIPANGKQTDGTSITRDGADLPLDDELNTYGQPETDCVFSQSNPHNCRDVSSNEVRTEFELGSNMTTRTRTRTRTRTNNSVPSVPTTKKEKRSKDKKERPNRQAVRPAHGLNSNEVGRTNNSNKKADTANEKAIKAIAVNERPKRPNESEAGGGRACNSSPPPVSVSHASKSGRRIRKAHWNYALRVFRALNMGVSEDSEAGKNEISSFARFFVNHGAYCDMPDIGLTEAKRLAKACAHKTPQYRARNWNRNMQGKAVKRAIKIK